MESPLGFVNLDRHFSPRDGSVPIESLAHESYLSGPHIGGEDLDWPALLSQRLVVILGEPGSGKSWEFRHISATLNDQGQDAFYLELERLVSRPLTETLNSADQARFRAWQRSDRSARFFLDSVDEAKLRRTVDFYTALDRVKDSLGSAVDRASFVVSSRISEWQPGTDRNAVLTRLVPTTLARRRNGREDADEGDMQILVVQIEPLNQEQIRKFVTANGIVEVEQFVASINDRHAWEFARRPVDVVSLINFWQLHSRLGTLTEIIEFDVNVKLRETAERRRETRLSEAEARMGAETLAAATVLCQAIHFAVPDDAFVGAPGVDAGNCLQADWTPDKCASLLSRPIFDSATYGTIRFHHRRVAEYLAAAWLRRRMDDGCPTSVLLQLLFNDIRGKKVARRLLLPVTAWLSQGDAPWNHEVRSHVLAAAPELHLDYGDPEALTIEYRRAVLRAIVARNEGRQRVWLSTSPGVLRRLASPELAPDLSELLRNRATSGDVRAVLIMLIRFGGLQECLPTLLEILANPESGDDLHVDVLAALRDMGSQDSLKQAWRILQERSSLSEELCGIACEAFYPQIIGPSELAVLFAKKPHERNDGPTHFTWTVERHFEEFVPANQRGALLAELNRLVQLPPHIAFNAMEAEFSDRYLWVLHVIPIVLLRLLENVALDAGECAVAAEAISLLGESRYLPYRDEEHIQRINAATLKHPGVRRVFLRQQIARSQADGANDIPSGWRLFDRGHIVTANESDAAWLVQEVTSVSEPTVQEICLNLALRLGAARTWQDRRRLRQTFGSNEALLRLIEQAVSESRWRPVRRLWSHWTDRYMWQDRASTFRHRLKWLWARWTSWWYLMRRLRSLRSGHPLGLLAELSREGQGNRMRFAPCDWATLTAKRGRFVSDAVKAGCKRHFRKSSPPSLPHERTERTIENSAIVGLVGIQALLDDHELDLNSMSDAEARLATRYAVNEMNGFPDWLSELGNAKSGPVGDVLAECVRGESQFPAERTQPYDVLADLAWEGAELARLVRSTVIELLHAGTPPNPQIFEFVIQILLKTATPPDTEVAAICVQRLHAEPDVAGDAFVLWACICLQLNAEDGLNVLEARFEKAETATDAMLQICNALNEDVRDRVPLLAQPDFLRPAALNRLVPLVFRFVRPEDDIERRHRRAYTPTARDQASRFRDGLLVRLSQNESPAAMDVLCELRGAPELTARRDWIQHLIDERAMKDSDLEAWSPSDLRTFTAEYKIASLNAPRPDLLIVTVNEYETQAVRDAFQVATSQKATTITRHGRVYHDFGVINGTRVFHAISEMGSGGLGGMQQTVDKAILSLEPAAVIAVGIAFGIDETEQAIGDILVSKQLRLYELQRVGKDEIVLRGSLPDASPRLLNYFRTFAQMQWTGAKVKFGLILTGEKLIDNVDYREQLVSFAKEAIGGEMEGAGLYVSGAEHKVDWLVLKAICDFADGNKGKQKDEKQKLAAANAAQFLVKALQSAGFSCDD